MAAPSSDVLDGAVAVTQLEPAPGPLDHLCHVPLLRRQPSQLTGSLLQVQACQLAAVLGLEPSCALGKEPLELLCFHEVDELGRQLPVAGRKVIARRGRQPVDMAGPATAV